MTDKSKKNQAPRKRASLSALLTGSDGKAGTVLVVLLLLAIPTALYYFYARARMVKVEVKGPPEAREVEVDPLRYNVGPEQPVHGVPAVPGAIETAEPAGVNERQAVAALQAGEYLKAAGFLREALKEEPGSAGLKRSLAASLAKAAEKEALAGDYLKAKELLSEASTLSADPAYLMSMANIQIGLDDLDGAAKTLAPLSGDPKTGAALKRIYTELGNRSLNSGEREAAAEYYGKGLSLDPTDEYLSAKLRQLRKDNEFEVRMGRSDAAHFIIRFDGGENATAGHLIGILLEEAYAKVGSDLNFYPDDRVEALLYSRENFRDITRSPSWAGALFDGRIKIPAGGVYEKTAELEKAVFHEYTHALVKRISKGRAPTWLNEGLAQYEEGRDISGYADYLKNVASTGKVRLKHLEGSFMGLDSNSASLAYLISLSATSHIIRDFGVFSVKRLLEKLGEGMTMDEAVQASLYLSYEELEKSWLDSLRR
jgi:tetratricopeptide (TPR) repeat protein